MGKRPHRPEKIGQWEEQAVATGFTHKDTRNKPTGNIITEAEVYYTKYKIIY